MRLKLTTVLWKSARHAWQREWMCAVDVWKVQEERQSAHMALIICFNLEGAGEVDCMLGFTETDFYRLSKRATVCTHMALLT